MSGESAPARRSTARSVRQPRIGRGIGGALVTVLCAARYPLVTMAGMFLAASVVTGALAGDFRTPAFVGALGFVAASTSLIVHEAAHLIALRLLSRDLSAGHVHYSTTEVWVVGQAPAGLGTVLVAISGPATGAAYLVAATLIGMPTWIAVSLALIHLVNLLPWFPDGKQLKLGLAQLLLGRIQRGLSSRSS